MKAYPISGKIYKKKFSGQSLTFVSVALRGMRTTSKYVSIHFQLSLASPSFTCPSRGWNVGADEDEVRVGCFCSPFTCFMILGFGRGSSIALPCNTNLLVKRYCCRWSSRRRRVQVSWGLSRSACSSLDWFRTRIWSTRVGTRISPTTKFVSADQ